MMTVKYICGKSVACKHWLTVYMALSVCRLLQSAAHQPCKGPNDEQPVGIVIAHEFAQANPHPQQQHAEQQSPDGSHEERVAVHADMGTKVGAKPATQARLALGGLA